MSPLARWLARERRRELRRVSLEDVLVFGRFSLYLWHRLRFFCLSRFVQAALHATELALFFFFASQQAFVAASVARLGTAVAGSAWWGGLEVLRTGVRERLRDGRFPLIAPWIRRWLLAAALLASVVAAAALAYALLALGRSRFGVGEAFVAARLLDLALQLVVQTFHGGAYALRRVYRPVWSILAPEVLRVALVLGLWPQLALWSVPLAHLAYRLAGSALTAWFSHLVYRDLDLPVLGRGGAARHRELAPGPAALRHFAAAAAAQASARVGHLWALSLFFFGAGEPDRWLELVVYFVLAAPLVDASLSWANLFYFDLKKLEDGLFRRYRRTLQRHVLRWSGIVGLLLWLPTLGATPWFLGAGSIGPVALATLLFFVARARLAARQLTAYCDRRYGLLLAVSLAVGAVAWSGRLLPLDAHLAGVVAGMVLGDLVLRPRSLSRPPSGRVVPLGSAVSLAPRLGGPGRWVLARLDPGRLLTGLPRLGHRLARQVGTVGGAGRRWLLWWRAEGADRRREPVELVGCEAQRWETEPARSAVAGLAPWRQRWPCGDLPLPHTEAEVVADFQERFPDGVWARAGEAAPERLRRALSWGERRAVLGAAEAHLLAEPARRLLRVDVSALLAGGEIAVLLFVDRRAPASSRKRWRRWVRQVGLANALAGLEAGPRPQPVGPRPWARSQLWNLLRAAWALSPK